ncbi:Beat-iib-like protein [Daphnia magna]|uniref:Beat-iib-like protein n=1 Tax=Daphnia magna TaxID=35525 RepID=A0A165AE58_9CRUS|nr:Beat-iib-like protein [Daphnia magna]
MNGTRPASQLSWLLNGHPVPLSMVEPYDPVLIKGDSTVRYYSAQLGLRFKMEPHLLLSAAHVDRLELTCVSRVGLRQSGDALIEGRAKWIVQRPITSTAGIRLQAAPVAGSTVDNWPAENDDDVGGGGGGRGRKNERVKEDEEDDDDYIRVGNNKQQEDDAVSLESDDATAQSDSENPSRRTQPVVGSHPENGRVTLMFNIGSHSFTNSGTVSSFVLHFYTDRFIFQVVYMYESESHTVNTEYGRIKIFYDTALWVTVNEVFLYTWVKLLCDAGNILCLLLGASVLTFFEIAEHMVNRLMALRLCFE